MSPTRMPVQLCLDARLLARLDRVVAKSQKSRSQFVADLIEQRLRADDEEKQDEERP